MKKHTLYLLLLSMMFLGGCELLQKGGKSVGSGLTKGINTDSLGNGLARGLQKGFADVQMRRCVYYS